MIEDRNKMRFTLLLIPIGLSFLGMALIAIGDCMYRIRKKKIFTTFGFDYNKKEAFLILLGLALFGLAMLLMVLIDHFFKE